MPNMNGVEATRLIHNNCPNIRIIGLTTFPEDHLVREMLTSGAVGYLMKNISVDELASAIRSAMTGKLTLAPEAAQALLNAPSVTPTQYHLTKRQLEVLKLMVKGYNNVEIAAELVVARSTVKFHVSRILAMMGVSSRVEAVRLAIESDLFK
jgi:NarL family two-component system response regulator LiaR